MLPLSIKILYSKRIKYFLKDFNFKLEERYHSNYFSVIEAKKFNKLIFRILYSSNTFKLIIFNDEKKSLYSFKQIKTLGSALKEMQKNSIDRYHAIAESYIKLEHIEQKKKVIEKDFVCTI